MKSTSVYKTAFVVTLIVIATVGCSKRSTSVESEKQPVHAQSADSQITSASPDGPAAEAKPMSKELPEQLQYLKPVLQKLASFNPESLGDDNPKAAALIDAATRERVRGLGKSEAKKTLRDDCRLLEKWLANPELENSPAHFVLGYLSGTIENE